MAPAAALPANADCPRCGAVFRCGVADAQPCACTTLTLSPALLTELARRYTGGCLCLDCLHALRDDHTKALTAA